MTGKPGHARRPRVIAGVDGSPHSAAALAWAAADARLRSWGLVIVTACRQDVPQTVPAPGHGRRPRAGLPRDAGQAAA
jgi:nucleotide-binding universal stress UspA family protein